jgi:branched-subunit amino acid aminotransferase/4-amino-4-deoxychorismate lyase
VSRPTGAGCVCVDGRFFAPGEATVSVLDAGFLLGDGLFESLRATAGVPYLLDRHLLRLRSAAATLEFADLPSTDTLRAQVHETLRRARIADAYVRVTVTRGVGAVGLAAPPASAPTVVIAVLPAPARIPAEEGIAASLLEAHAGERPTVKSTSWQLAVLDRRRVQRLGAEEGIYVSSGDHALDGDHLLDGDHSLACDHVLEGVSSNVFAVVGERLLTPPASVCLPGITRARVLELASDAGVTALEAPLELDTLRRAEEIFVTNAVQGLRRVGTLAGAAVGRGTAEGVFTTLRDRYEQDRLGAALAAR